MDSKWASIYSNAQGGRGEAWLDWNGNPIGFLMAGPGNPAYWGLLLYRAGDIEKNPGPVSSKFPCGVCKEEVGNELSPQCASCKHWIHLKCSGLSKIEISKLPKRHTWSCMRCTHSNLTEHVPTKEKGATRILQWNVRGVKSNRAELEMLLKEHDVDVACIQETWLTKDKEFNMKGYNCIRADRNTSRQGAIIIGGGVMTLVKNGLSYSKDGNRLTALDDQTTDAVRIHLHSKSNTLSISNLYVPPIGSTNDVRTQNFNPSCLPVRGRSVLCGDVNCHAETWDPICREDDLGLKLQEWIDGENLVCLNSGEPTRLDHEGNPSSPDVTIASTELLDDTTWRVLQDSYGSDHYPIILDIAGMIATNVIRQKARLSYRRANWAVFQKEVDGILEKSKESDWIAADLQAITNLNRCIVRAMNKAAKVAIPKGGVVNPKPWWNDDVRNAFSIRRQLGKLAHKSESDMKKWKDSCRLARLATLKAKREYWRSEVDKLDAKTDSSKVFRTLAAIDGRLKERKSGEALVVEGKTITDSKAKATAFCKMYAGVSNVKCAKEDRPVLRSIQKIRGKCTGCMYCQPFMANELDYALSKLKPNSAPGADGVHNLMLANMTETGKSKILLLFNKVLASGFIPTDWKNATIKPLLKAGKDPAVLGSYRPISLTSCVCKVFERMLKARLGFWLESTEKLSPNQNGFRSLRSTEQQIQRITQYIADGFQNKEKSVMLLVDFSRAFDTVWHVGLLHKLVNMNTPRCLYRCIKSFLGGRKAKVEYEFAESNYRHFHGGVPQGTVLSPSLFLCFINDIADELPANVEVSLFADDVALITRDENKTEAAKRMQEAVHVLEKWAKKWKMVISKEKTEVCYFTKNNKEARHKPKICYMDGTRVTVTEHPKFLGVTFDRTMSFTKHVALLKKKIRGKLSAMKAIAGKSWGSSKEDLRAVFLAYIQSSIEYAGGAWMPLATETALKQLQREQTAGARIIAGPCAGSSEKKTLNEAGLVPLQKRKAVLATTAYEKAKRLPLSNPLRIVADDAVTERLKSVRSWREEGRIIATETGLEALTREELVLSNLCPWKRPRNLETNCRLEIGSRKTDTPEARKEAAELTLSGLDPPTITMFTDGSAVESTENGGAGIYIEMAEQKIRLSYAAGRFTSSYKAEQIALLKGLDQLKNLPLQSTDTIWILTDSQSLVENLNGGIISAKTKSFENLWTSMSEVCNMVRKVIVQWIPGHAGIEGNEVADKLAGEGNRMEQSDAPIDFETAKTTIKRIHRNKLATELIRAGIRPPPNRDKEANLSRRERRILAQLRCGEKSPILNWYLHHIRKAPTPRCSMCNYNTDDLNHALWDCPIGDGVRHIYLPMKSDSVLYDEPANVIRFLRACARLKSGVAYGQ